MTSQLLIGAKRWEPSGSSLGHCGNNALAIITRTARYHITYTKKGAATPLKRRCMYGARGETRRAFASRSPGLQAHGALATLRYKQATGLFA